MEYNIIVKSKNGQFSVSFFPLFSFKIIISYTSPRLNLWNYTEYIVIFTRVRDLSGKLLLPPFHYISCNISQCWEISWKSSFFCIWTPSRGYIVKIPIWNSFYSPKEGDMRQRRIKDFEMMNALLWEGGFKRFDI